MVRKLPGLVAQHLYTANVLIAKANKLDHIQDEGRFPLWLRWGGPVGRREARGPGRQLGQGQVGSDWTMYHSTPETSTFPLVRVPPNTD